MSLVAELQRRKVFKVAAAYLVVGWLLIQVAATVFPSFGIPEWALRFTTLIVLLGFPVALIMAWVFDVTPEGVRIETTAAGTKRMFAIAALLVALALGWHFRGALPGAAPDAGTPRLAVLPFANFSPDPNNAFFADGLHDDLLTALSHLKGVDVISRTTMETFKGSGKKVTEIAAEIDATHVLEGSVRRDDLRVRLTVQLIDARTDDHVWAKTYDRTLADALTLQTAVAGELATALKVALGGAGEEAAPTSVPAAYDLYLKARLSGNGEARLELLGSALQLDPDFTLARAARAIDACNVLWFNDTRSAVLAPQARADIDRARAERPDLAEVEVAEAMYLYYVGRDWPAALARVDGVLARDANNVGALRARGFLLRRVGRMDEAIASARRYHELDPANVNAITAHADLLQFYGRYREALAVLDEGLGRLPADSADWGVTRGLRNAVAFFLTGDRAAFLADIDGQRGKVPEDQRLANHYSASDPSPERLAYLVARPDPWQKADDGALYPSALDVAVEADLLGDDATRARALEDAARLYATLSPQLMARPFTIGYHAIHLALRGERAAAVAAAEQAVDFALPSKDATATVQVNQLAMTAFARSGETARALDLLEATAAMPSFNGAVVYHDPYLRKLLGAEPRYQALMKRIESRFQPL